MPPKKRARTDDDDQIPNKIGIFDIPDNVRAMILNEMDLPTLSKYSQCSKMCNQEVTSSPRYLRSISLKDDKKLFVLDFFKTDDSGESKLAWSLEFDGSTKGTTKIRCRKSDNKRICWSENEKGSVETVVIKYTNKYLQRFKDSLLGFSLCVEAAAAKSKFIRGIRVRNMTKLQFLNVNKTRKQICLLTNGFVDFEQIKKVSCQLTLPATKLTLEQLSQLTASNIHIWYMDLTPDDLAMYLASWSEGELQPNLEFLSIDAEYDERLAKKRIELNLNLVDYDDMEVWDHKVCFYVHGDCSRLECHSAYVRVFDKGMLLEMRIENNS